MARKSESSKKSKKPQSKLFILKIIGGKNPTFEESVLEFDPPFSLTNVLPFFVERKKGAANPTKFSVAVFSSDNTARFIQKTQTLADGDTVVIFEKNVFSHTFEYETDEQGLISPVEK